MNRSLNYYSTELTILLNDGLQLGQKVYFNLVKEVLAYIKCKFEQI